VLLVAGFNGIGRSYLSFGAYRADVILRESVVVGLVGAGGLGVVLLESLSSFAWGEVLPVLVVYAALTLVGEQLADLYRRRLLSGPLPQEGCPPSASS
jgi:phosphonate transport system permease protein